MKTPCSKTLYFVGILFLTGLYFVPTSSYAQHRGDNLAFQDLDVPHGNGVKSLAMGGAYTSISDGINSLFRNPAGLATMKGLQLSFETNYSRKNWQENQVYHPSRGFTTLSFMLEGLYEHNPAFTGMYDYEIFHDDTNYTVKEPLLATDYYAEEAADWKKGKNAFDLNHIAIGIPLQIAGKSIAIAAAYNMRNQVWDYDRNHTHLFPHLGSTYYEGLIEEVTGPEDSLRVLWSDYSRERTGNIWDMNAAVAIELNRHIKFGFSLKNFSGEIKEMQGLDRVGYFDLVDNNTYRFAYDTLDVRKTGTSKINGISFNAGIMLELDRFSIGARLTSPRTLKREWQYTTHTTDSKNTTLTSSTGNDEVDIPLSYAIGASISPGPQFRIAFDIENTKYSSTQFSFAGPDSTHRDWVDQTTWCMGMEYKPFTWLALLGGYRFMPRTFVPDGAAIKDRGPAIESFSFGLSLKAFYGRFDIAYEIQRLKYYDSYYSNTNYVMETLGNLRCGYVIIL
ncbi:hypothetical protein GF407_07110 [candidate division KSB1 bacterium]|nr:hypothetical protein [candidate division KSB1 bacterium]